MNPKQRAFRRKISYLLAIAGLLMLLSLLGRPATRGTGGGEGGRGGKLAQLRKTHGISQTQLGDIDPTSETIKLASFGLRGVAVTLLWQKRHQYQMKKDWTNLSAVHEQIAKLQPNFVSVWIFQAWNLSYNVSAEFDDFQERYRWVMKGINFLRKGIVYNERDPTLLWQLGRDISQKIGRSDEYLQFRVLFREDDKFHDSLPFVLTEQDPRDNWLVGKEYHIRTEQLFHETGVPVKRLAPVIYLSNIPLCQMYYAEAKEDDGFFGEVARRAWARAGKEWYDYGDKLLTTSRGEEIRLNQLDDREKRPNLQDEIRQLTKELEALGPEDIREKIRERRWKGLSGEQREAYEAEEKTVEQHTLAQQAETLLEIGHKDIADSKLIPAANRTRALELSKLLDEKVKKARAIRRYRSITAFASWRHKAEMEQKLLNFDPAELRELLGTDEIPDSLDPARLMITVSARELTHEGSKAFDRGRLKDARKKYRLGSALWSKVLEISAQRKAEREKNRLSLGDQPKPPGEDVDDTFVDEIQRVLNNYRIILDKDGDLFPEDFRLKDYVHRWVGRAPNAVAARGLVDETEKDLAKAGPNPKREEYVVARAAYRDAAVKWRDVLNANPSVGFGADPQTIDELLGLVERYGDILTQLDEVFPEDFALRRFVRVHVGHATETRAARESVADAEDALVEAERALAVGNESLAKEHLRTADREFAKALTEWQAVLGKFPSLLLGSDRATLDELSELIENYRDTQPDRKLSPDFPLGDVVDLLRRVK